MHVRLKSASLAAVALSLALLAGPPEAAVAGAAVATSAGTAAGASALSPAQQRYLRLAQAGVAEAALWRDHRRSWYDGRLHDRDRFPLATLWDIVPLFEALDAIAIAAPSPANRSSVARFARGAERYLNRGLRPLPGYSPYSGDSAPSTQTWFDDNGWWGLAFVNAYRATGARRWLGDAQRALDYIAAVGWDPREGGIWWNTSHPYKAGEALASATLLAVLLYQETRSAVDLADAQRFLAWADTRGFSPADGLYARTSADHTPADYVQSPLIYAQALLCRLTGNAGECERAELLKVTAVRRFGYLLDFAPQYDAVYLQWLLALYALDGDATLYRMAADNARDAATRAANAQGLYELSWNGEVLPALYAVPGMLRTHAATTSLFAWLAVYAPPA